MRSSRTALSILFLLLTGIVSAGANPKREMRGAWLHVVGNSEMSRMSADSIQSWLTATVDKLKEAGCNTVFFQVRPCADAMYPSDIEPWTKYLTGTQGQAPSPLWDPLQFMIEICHERGMELHAWLNPYRVATTTKDKLSPGHLYHSRPELFVTYGGQIYFDPGQPESRVHILKVVRDIVSRYDVDGIHFDDYFYPYPVAGKDFPDSKSFSKYAAGQGFDRAHKDDWRRNNVTLLIGEVNATVKEIKPWVRFGVSPFGIHRNIGETPDGSRTNGLSGYASLYADTPLWARKGYVDYLAPQLYWKIGHKAADYETLIKWWDALSLPGHLYIGQSIETFSEPDLQNPRTTQMARKMELVRDLPEVNGNIWWPGWELSSGQSPVRDSLAAVYQSTPALLPAYTDIDSTAPDGVEAWISHVSGQLRWLAEPTEDVMQQPHFFIIYRFRDDEDVDIAHAENIFMITRDSSFTPEKPAAGHCDRYVVTVVDRCWNESAPSQAVEVTGE